MKPTEFLEEYYKKNKQDTQLPEQEISDQEIEKASYEFWKFNEHTQSTCWRMGAKWYREHLKKLNDKKN
jgi:hypothetical protein